MPDEVNDATFLSGVKQPRIEKAKNYLTRLLVELGKAADICEVFGIDLEGFDTLQQATSVANWMEGQCVRWTTLVFLNKPDAWKQNEKGDKIRFHLKNILGHNIGQTHILDAPDRGRIDKCLAVNEAGAPDSERVPAEDIPAKQSKKPKKGSW